MFRVFVILYEVLVDIYIKSMQSDTPVLCLIVPTSTYSFALLKWSSTDYKQTSRNTCNLQTRHNNNNPKLFTPRTSLPLSEQVRIFLSLFSFAYGSRNYNTITHPYINIRGYRQSNRTDELLKEIPTRYMEDKMIIV